MIGAENAALPRCEVAAPIAGLGPTEPRGPAQCGPRAATIGPVVRLELERVEALELLGMTLAHLSNAEARGDMSPRAPLLMAIRDKLAQALREE